MCLSASGVARHYRRRVTQNKFVSHLYFMRLISFGNECMNERAKRDNETMQEYVIRDKHTTFVYYDKLKLKYIFPRKWFRKQARIPKRNYALVEVCYTLRTLDIYITLSRDLRNGKFFRTSTQKLLQRNCGKFLIIDVNVACDVNYSISWFTIMKIHLCVLKFH